MSENIHIRCSNDGCSQITVGCITLTNTCVVRTKAYPKALVYMINSFVYTPRAHGT